MKFRKFNEFIFVSLKNTSQNIAITSLLLLILVFFVFIIFEIFQHTDKNRKLFLYNLNLNNGGSYSLDLSYDCGVPYTYY